MDKYILLTEKDKDIQRLGVVTLRYFYGGNVLTAATSGEALEILKNNGSPELVIADLDILNSQNSILYSYLEEQKFSIPVIATSLEHERDKVLRQFPVISEMLPKPISVDMMTHLVKGMIHSPVESPSHVPIDIKSILDLSCTNFDLYLKLSGVNYVKIIKKEDVFSFLDAQKLMSKGVKDLYILSSDAFELLRSWEKGIKYSSFGITNDSSGQIVLAIETLENVERIARAMNWSREVLLSASKVITNTVSLLSKDERIASVIQKRLSNRSSPFTTHVGLLSFLCCALNRDLKLAGESGDSKLVMAAILHDLTIEDYYYENITEWDKRASNLRDKSPETIKYRHHPLQAANLAQTFEFLPPDVAQIILQHHERPDGGGYPRSLTASRISHFSALFIMVEDLIKFIGNGENLETSIIDYVMWGNEAYDQGTFKKIFEQIKSRLLS